MATNPIMGGASPALPLDVLLSAIPSLPRPLLSRLADRMIERLDEIDGDPDLEGIDEREPELTDDGLSDRHIALGRTSRRCGRFQPMEA